ncbi:Lrp/AsnC family transcriptional regulator [Peteryoungia algae]|jgi:DNA-binding Lrp family transcriptional regulator|uniref:Lrp/AsnC family transcriptional regulator n=1 Tax=Peteryoungia algae TaxID=2919917 RepID=A0ABT0D496_9HYPH|nr:Lrp/AsnC family transcriptional regulator [Rhizobium sp. SSM4.3]MCJ8240233.1 Lrp/AsnC family transcriptional regulator [Rhizobium sp. SSM4.3]
MPKLDKFDHAILGLLQDDARTTNVEIADKVGLSQSPCLRRIRQMEESGIIRGYRADLDRRALGLELTVFVAFKVARHTRENADTLQQALLDIPEVVACYMTSGESDFLAEVVVENLSAYEALLTERLLVLPNVTDIRSNFAIRSIKTGAPLKLPARS